MLSILCGFLRSIYLYSSGLLHWHWRIWLRRTSIYPQHNAQIMCIIYVTYCKYLLFVQSLQIMKQSSRSCKKLAQEVLCKCVHKVWGLWNSLVHASIGHKKFERYKYSILQTCSLIFKNPYMVLPLFATRFAACTEGIPVSFMHTEYTSLKSLLS